MLKQDVSLSDLEFITDLSPSESERVTGGKSCKPGETNVYVDKGYTLSSIAARYSKTCNAYDLADYNDIPNPDRIYVGQRLCVPDYC